MKTNSQKSIALWLCACCLFLFTIHGQTNGKQIDASSFVKGEIIIKLRNNVSLQKIKSTAENPIGIPQIDKICKKSGSFETKHCKSITTARTKHKKNRPDMNRIMVIKYADDVDIFKVIEELKATGQFEYVEPNYIGESDAVVTQQANMEFLPNDLTNRMYWAKNDGTFIGFRDTAPEPVIDADIDMTDAWQIATGSSDVIVAFLDSGIDPTNMEFAGRLLPGYDFVNEDNIPNDDESHGTNVTGLATMTGNNNFGLAGVDWNCKIMPLKVLNANNGFTDEMDVSEAIIYAVDNGAHVINMSLGFNTDPSFLKDAVEYAYTNGVVMVASAGNSDGFYARWPSTYPEVFSIGATDLNDWRVRKEFTGSWGSNFATYIDVVAPGNWMLSARHNNNQSFTWWKGGTSMATPLVTGVVSLLLGINPDLTIEEIRSIIRGSADDLVGDPKEDTPGFDIFSGYGRLNAHQALLAVTNTCSSVGTPCDDGDACTTNDTITKFCLCEGTTLPDSDGDGVCDSKDICPDFTDFSIGRPCDDNDPCTTNDVYIDCGVCKGTIEDKDYDGICVSEDPDDNDACNPDPDNINCLSCTVFNTYDFETQNGSWRLGNSSSTYNVIENSEECPSGRCAFVSGSRSSFGEPEGSDLFNAGYIESSPFDFSNKPQAKISFTTFPYRTRDDQSIDLEISVDGGTSFKLHKRWIQPSDYSEGVQAELSTSIPPTALSENVILRLISNSSSSRRRHYIDNIQIEICDFDPPRDCVIGASCDDGNPATDNDQYIGGCFCVGSYKDNTLSINNPGTTADDVNFSLFPNPTSAKIMISFKGAISPKSVRIYDIKGMSLYDQELDQKSALLELDIADFSEGLYMLELTTTNGATLNKKFIKVSE